MVRVKTICSWLSVLVLIGPFIHCREAYVSPYIPPATGFLVVEGYISGNLPASYTLSRVARLQSDSSIIRVTGAQVQIEGNDNSIYPLTGSDSGVYTSAGALGLNPAVQYRLRITTAQGIKYLSDYVPYKTAPALDSVNWVETGDGVTIYANAHDDAAATRYYMWNYDETYEYHSSEQSFFYFNTTTNQVTARDSAMMIYRCWRGGPSTNILSFSTEKLARDVVYEYPLRFVPANSIELSQLYSMNLRQYALTKAGYEFMSLMKQNTEIQGSIFDAQPSELNGNIHCLTNPQETVVGYVSAGSVTQERIFISHVDLPNWIYFTQCPKGDTTFRTQAEFIANFGQSTYIPVDRLMAGGYLANESLCIDCRMQGGTNAKPAYWPN